MRRAVYQAAPIIAACLLIGAGQTKAEEPSLDPYFLWPAPETNALGISLFGGYTLGDRFDGANLGTRAMFFFRYFIAGFGGDMTFAEDGTSYSLLLDLNGRYGPVRVGFLFGLHWLPGRGGSPSPGIGGQVALTIPLGIDGFWLDLAYRPNLIFLESTRLSYHAINLGLLIEAGL